MNQPADAFEVLRDVEAIWASLAQVPDPEIPVLSIVDLGIVRGVRWDDDICVVTITPTYSGCPAMRVIEASVQEVLAAEGIAARVETRLAPAWTTDWMSARGKAALRDYGIAPPAQQVIDLSGIRSWRSVDPAVACPRCASTRTRLISGFGSTACKALYRCEACLEPFDYFKPH